jgi:hypothetical protein
MLGSAGSRLGSKHPVAQTVLDGLDLSGSGAATTTCLRKQEDTVDSAASGLMFAQRLILYFERTWFPREWLDCSWAFISGEPTQCVVANTLPLINQDGMVIGVDGDLDGLLDYIILSSNITGTCDTAYANRGSLGTHYSISALDSVLTDQTRAGKGKQCRFTCPRHKPINPWRAEIRRM